MAFTLVDSGQGNVDHVATSTSFTFGVSLQEGDWVIAQSACDTLINDIITSGYTYLSTNDINNPWPLRWTVAYKRMGSIPDTSISFSKVGTTSQGASCIYQVWRGVDTSTAFYSTSLELGSSNTPYPQPPSISAGTSTLVFHLGAHDDDIESTATITLQDGTATMTNYQAQNSGGSAGQSCTVMIASELSTAVQTWSSGGFNTASNDGWGAMSFVLNVGSTAAAALLGHGLIYALTRNYALVR